MNCATILEKETTNTSARQRQRAFKHDEPSVATCNKAVTRNVAHDLITCVQTGIQDLLSNPSTSDTTPAPKLSCDEIISEDSLFLTLSVSYFSDGVMNSDSWIFAKLVCIMAV
ncbi:unnamed protein product, partial [Cuscuta europaea]